MVCELSLNPETQAQYQSCFRYSADPHPSQCARKKTDFYPQAVIFPFRTLIYITIFMLPSLPNPHKHASITFPLSPSTSLPTPFRMLNSHQSSSKSTPPYPAQPPHQQLTQSSPSHTPHTADADNDNTETYNAHLSDSGCVCICSR